MTNEYRLTLEIIDSVKDLYNLRILSESEKRLLLGSNDGNINNLTFWSINKYENTSFLYATEKTYSYEEIDGTTRTVRNITKQEINFSLLINSDFDLPSTEIRPKSFYDKLETFFGLKHAGFMGAKHFNKKYLIETLNQPTNSEFLSDGIINRIANLEGFHLTYKKNKAYLRIKRNQSLENVSQLLSIGELVDKLFKTQHIL